MSKTYSVRFCWYMPVCATYEVEVPDDATPERIIGSAHAAAAADGWRAQKDIIDGISPVFVDVIEAEDGTSPFEIPHDWSEEHVRGDCCRKVGVRTAAPNRNGDVTDSMVLSIEKVEETADV